MRIRVHFILFAVLLLIIIGLFIYTSTHPTATMLFFIGEGIVVVSLIYLLIFYNSVVKPLHIIANGMDLLKEQDFSSRLRQVGQVETDRIVQIFNRMMDQLKAERLLLREQNHFLDLLIDASPMGVLLMSFDQELTHCNPIGLRMIGVALGDVQGRKLHQINSPLAQELDKIPRGETQTIRLNDANIYKCTHSSFVDHGFPHSFYLIEILTNEVVKAEKRAYEKVIRLIAHEVNNTTAGITSTLDSVNDVLTEFADTDDLREVMQVCIERCYSMSRFITRFADVVKIPEPKFSPVDLNHLLADCIRFMEGICAESEIQLILQTLDLPPQRMDASLMEQVLVNIIKNAAESIEHSGTIQISVLHPAGIEVADNGKGIAPEIEQKLFTPFFSTKPKGQGIGLIFIREVLNGHGCSFSLRTEADGWTRFRIYFP